MLAHDDHDDQNPFTGLSAHMAEHLRNEVHEELADLGEIQHAMHQLESKAYRRTRRINKHMKHCGDCLSEQIKSGMLIELSDYWQLHTQSGGGRYPKLHYQVN